MSASINRRGKAAKFSTRDEWLEAAKVLLDPLFVGTPAKPRAIRASVGFPAGSRSSKSLRTIGICHYNAEDATPQIWIHPEIVDPARVLDILVHELAHAYLPVGTGHGGDFKRTAEAVGLTGRMVATVAGPDFTAVAKRLLAVLGPYPHSRLTYSEARGRKQTTRQILVDCPCGIKFRASRTVLESIADLRCPDGDCSETPEIKYPS